MLRQRLRNRGSSFAFLASAATVLAALLLIWGGLIVLLLALKVGPDTVQSITGYASAYDFLRELGAEDFDGTTRAITAAAGGLALVPFGYGVFRLLPRPYLARGDIDLSRDERGEVVVEPRAIERLTEAAAERKEGVAAARGRQGTDELTVDVTLRRSREVAETLAEVRAAVREALEQHGVPVWASCRTACADRARHPRRRLAPGSGSGRLGLVVDGHDRGEQQPVRHPDRSLVGT